MESRITRIKTVSGKNVNVAMELTLEIADLREKAARYEDRGDHLEAIRLENHIAALKEELDALFE